MLVVPDNSNPATTAIARAAPNKDLVNFDILSPMLILYHK
jgi:hypothetical protein